MDAGVVLEAGRDGLAQRPERERAELHQREHHRPLLNDTVDVAAALVSSYRARRGGGRARGSALI